MLEPCCSINYNTDIVGNVPNKIQIEKTFHKTKLYTRRGAGDNGHKFTLNDRYVKTGYFVCLSLFLLTPRLRLANLKSSRSGKNSRMIFEKHRENAFFPATAHVTREF